jgi:uncharacterized protein YidB (DUF937 family)
MGVLDVINGMQSGPRGPSDPNTKGGMSPMTLAILGVLAYKAVKHLSGSQATTGSATLAPSLGKTANADLSGGGLSDLFKGGFGGLLASGAAGSVISGGLGDLLRQFQQSGHGDTANSWVSAGPNKPISVDDLANVLGADQINTLIAQTGLSRDELLAGLSQHLPEVVNQLTPAGRLPNESEVSL